MSDLLIVVTLLVALAAAATALLTLREVRRLRATISDDSQDPAARAEGIIKSLRATVRREHRHTRAVIDGLFSLSGLSADGATMPTTQGWAASPMVLRQLAEQVIEHRPDLVVELGGGGSSVLLGRLLKMQGHGRVVSIDHDPGYAELTREHLRRHGVADVVEVRVAPLVPVEAGGDTHTWYDPAAFTDLHDIDLLFVDGPPGGTGPLARFPAVPVLTDRCRPGAVVLLDDGARAPERRMADRWIAEHGATEVASDDIGTGWTQLRLP